MSETARRKHKEKLRLEWGRGGQKFGELCPKIREAPVRFGSVTVWRWNGSSGSGFRFRRFLCKKGFSVFQYSLTGKDGSGFGSWKTVPAVPVPLSVSGKTVPTVPVSGSGSVPEPPCKMLLLGNSRKIKFRCANNPALSFV